jgi:hypothetical protein
VLPGVPQSLSGRIIVPAKLTKGEAINSEPLALARQSAIFRLSVMDTS